MYNSNELINVSMCIIFNSCEDTSWADIDKFCFVHEYKIYLNTIFFLQYYKVKTDFALFSSPANSGAARMSLVLKLFCKPRKIA